MAVDEFGLATARKANVPFGYAGPARTAPPPYQRVAGMSYPASTKKVGAVSSSLQPASPSTGTAAAAIQDHWATLPGAGAAIGRAVSEVARTSDDGYYQAFERGLIYWWPDTGAVNVGNVELVYAGMNCFNETSRLSGSDEPYFIVSHVGDSNMGTSSGVHYQNVDAGGSFPYPSWVVYSGSPGHHLSVTVFTMEQDQGDPAEIQAKIAGAFASVGGAVGTVVSLAATPAAGGVVITVAGALAAISAVVVPLVASQDDVLGDTSMMISAKTLVTSYMVPRKTDRNVVYDVSSDMISGDGANYKVYFTIENYGW
ncbi:hypothetical protein [Microbacterium pumilum]|uniref:Uncharacterized protein n=1 Tax=Microbacterium pumilum TaxID=344165 RepID=A0ABN2T604_9MICO